VGDVAEYHGTEDSAAVPFHDLVTTIGLCLLQLSTNCKVLICTSDATFSHGVMFKYKVWFEVFV
jgi:hypothetical protein